MAIKADSLPEREIYRTSGPDVYDAARSSLTVHRLVNNTPDDNPIKSADMLRIQGINIADEERTQIVVNNVDSGKLYLFGRQPRLYTVSAFIIDSDLDPGIGKESLIYAGSSHLFSKWLALYEEYFRLTKCYEYNLIGRLRWRTSEYWGYVMSNMRSMESSNQNLITIGFVFAHVFGEEHVNLEIVKTDDGHSFPGMISKEGYERMRWPIYGDPWKNEPPKSPLSKFLKGRNRA